jgi:hypothetical protein
MKTVCRHVLSVRVVRLMGENILCYCESCRVYVYSLFTSVVVSSVRIDSEQILCIGVLGSSIVVVFCRELFLVIIDVDFRTIL